MCVRVHVFFYSMFASEFDTLVCDVYDNGCALKGIVVIAIRDSLVW